MTAEEPPRRARQWRLRALAAASALGFALVSGELLIRQYSRRDSSTGLFEPVPTAIPTTRGRPFASGVWHGEAVQFNRLGLREREFPPRPAPGVKRVLVLGDSVTFGQGVAQEFVYTRVAERELNHSGAPRIEILNLGMPGFNTTQELAQLRELVSDLAPDAVVVGFYYNDVDELPPATGDLTRTPSRTWPAMIGGLKRRSLLLAWMAPRVAELMRRAGFHAQGELNRIEARFAPTSPGWLSAQRALLEMRQLASRHGFGLSVLILPATVDYRGPVAPLLAYHRAVREFCAANSIPFADVLEEQQASNARDWSGYWISPVDGHPDARAHLLIGATLAKLAAGAEPVPAR